jgi:ankyrin repeat protein
MKRLTTYNVFESKYNYPDSLGLELIKAVYNNDIKEVEVLIKKGANIDMQDDDGWTALLTSYKNENITKMLVNAGADLNIKEYMGNTALNKSDNVKGVEMLIKAGADMTIRNSHDENFIESIRRDNEELYKWFHSEKAQRMILSREPSLIKSFKKVNIEIHPKIKKEFLHITNAIDLNLL